MVRDHTHSMEMLTTMLNMVLRIVTMRAARILETLLLIVFVAVECSFKLCFSNKICHQYAIELNFPMVDFLGNTLLDNGYSIETQDMLVPIIGLSHKLLYR